MAVQISSTSSRSRSADQHIRWRIGDSGRSYHFEISNILPTEALNFYEKMKNIVGILNITTVARFSDGIVTATILYKDLPDTLGAGLYGFAEACCSSAGELISRRNSNICVPRIALNYDSQFKYPKDNSTSVSSSDCDLDEQEIDVDSFRVVEEGLARELALWCELRMALALL